MIRFSRDNADYICVEFEVPRWLRWIVSKKVRSDLSNRNRLTGSASREVAHGENSLIGGSIEIESVRARITTPGQ